MTDDKQLVSKHIPVFSGFYSIHENHIKKCLNELRRAHPGYLITILGPNNVCGLGKTTFASKLANSVEVNDYFRFGTIWVTVGDNSSEKELLKLVQLIAIRIIEDACDSVFTTGGLCRSDLMRRVTPPHITPSLEDCVLAMKDLFKFVHLNSPGNEKCLIVLDDVRDDRLVRVLVEIDAVVLATTRYPELFSGRYPGSTYLLEPMSVQQQTRIMCVVGGLYEADASMPPVAMEVLSSCLTLFEVDIMCYIMS